jgi:hypothetical protein
MVNELELIKKQYDIDGNFQNAIDNVNFLFKELNKTRFDVANCVFDYNPLFQKAFMIEEWTPKVTKYYTSIKNKDMELECFDMLYATISMRGTEGKLVEALAFTELVKSIFDQETFLELEKSSLQSQKEIMLSTMTLKKGFSFSQEELINQMTDHYKTEAKNTFYENEINKILKEVTEELLN